MQLKNQNLSNLQTSLVWMLGIAMCEYGLRMVETSEMLKSQVIKI